MCRHRLPLFHLLRRAYFANTSCFLGHGLTSYDRIRKRPRKSVNTLPGSLSYSITRLAAFANITR